jgi:hypothetical protein
MIYGFEDGKFYVEYHGCNRPVGNMRQESDQRARDLVEQGGKFMLGFSGGLDSQSVLQSFRDIGAPIETAFLYLPGYNDNEYEQVKFLDSKYQIKTHIVDMDPMSVKDEVIRLSNELNIPGKNNILQSIFLSMLPDDYNFVQMVHDPFCFVNPVSYNIYYFYGYYLPEISRERAFNRLNRKGKNIFYGDTSEFLLSILSDDVFRGALASARYFDGNGLDLDGKYLKTVDRWDYYIKPIIYGKYWSDTLTYFPKYQGFEKIPYLQGNPLFRKHATVILYQDLINVLSTPSEIKRVYENASLYTYN